MALGIGGAVAGAIGTKRQTEKIVDGLYSQPEELEGKEAQNNLLPEFMVPVLIPIYKVVKDFSSGLLIKSKL
jgi:hypothetical protein